MKKEYRKPVLSGKNAEAFIPIAAAVVGAVAALSAAEAAVVGVAAGFAATAMGDKSFSKKHNDLPSIAI